ncbi:STAS domain-containing protein [Actinoplanes sp. KI2]|uniref:STAS domain-containing protein n=1 Tax=Actinoplanes sp. KI2 TaxID=2983315 RepID=UPI0021D5E46D|nr:STAS domain-containing protein [Actinoplanes sp. KI2]MCU7730390.1 STAS domain-containing protein [Actinoplanes sp. KI2]
MGTPFAVARRVDEAGVSRLMVVGELDEDTGAVFAGLLVNAVQQDGVSVVVVDLRRVTFLSAAGVRALLRGRAAADGLDRGFRVVNAVGIVYQVLRISGVHKTLAVTWESDVAAS